MLLGYHKNYYGYHYAVQAYGLYAVTRSFILIHFVTGFGFEFGLSLDLI